MEELRIKAGSLELNVSGESGTIKEASKDFYNHLAARDQRETEAKMALAERMQAKMALAERMQAKMAWYAKEYDEKHQAEPAEKQEEVAPESGNATLRMVQASAMSWGMLANRIKAGVNLAVGDKVDFRLKSGEDVTVVVTQSTEEYVRFESVDCVGGKEVPWSAAGNTKCGIAASDVMKYLNEEIWSQLPEDLQAAIAPVKRKHKDHEGNVQEYEFRLFLPAASEVFDEDECYGDQGVYEQLDYYKDRRHRMKGEAKGEDTDLWWLASVRSGSSTTACFVRHDGLAHHWHASYALRVPLCFCIRKS
ncbi:MAG: DUF6273 domain-containing protein [Acetatifactor muris]|nr:DUF6273 domain-containing protein [Acetatifactor muris]MCM1559585.1 DUF6273 domain-containing protein [Butyrivibrio sp.]